MNILGLVFGILLVFSFGFYACFDKQLGAHRLRSKYLSHEKAMRKIYNSYQSSVYQICPGKPLEKKPSAKGERNPNANTEREKALIKHLPNRSCAKINLFSLADQPEEKDVLFSLAQRLIQNLYSPLFSKEKDREKHFFPTLLKNIRLLSSEDSSFALEKLSFEDPAMQLIFYRMLKGTKKWDIAKKIGYPPLTEFFSAEKEEKKICLFHASYDFLHLLFGSKGARAFYEKVHHREGIALTKELVETIGKKSTLIPYREEFLALFEYGRNNHPEEKQLFVAEGDQGEVLLKRRLSLAPPL